MRQPTGKKSSTWFRVGITLLSISAFFWVMFIIIELIDRNQEKAYDVGSVAIGFMILTVIPIGVGIYGIWRGRQPGEYLVITWMRFLSILVIFGGFMGVFMSETIGSEGFSWLAIAVGVGIGVGSFILEKRLGSKK